MSVYSSNCFKADFTYLVSSVNEKDSSSASSGLSFLSAMGVVPYDAMLQRVVVMETTDDLRNLREFA